MKLLESESLVTASLRVLNFLKLNHLLAESVLLQRISTRGLYYSTIDSYSSIMEVTEFLSGEYHHHS